MNRILKQSTFFDVIGESDGYKCSANFMVLDNDILCVETDGMEFRVPLYTLGLKYQLEESNKE